MRLYLENIGMIKEADVKLEGLTVIAGENDTGKSTVGKVIFSIVKGIQKYEETIGKKIENKLEEIGKILIDLSIQKILKREKNIEELELFKQSLEKIEKENINLNDFLCLIKKIEDKKIKNKIKEIENLISKDEKSIKEEALKRAFFSEFREQLKLNNSKEGEIKIKESSTCIKILIENKKINLNNNFELSLEDVTLIETPMILNFSDMIQSAISHFEEEELGEKNTLIKMKADVIYHSKDLINKLVNAAKFFENNEVDEELLKFLKFDFEYNKQTREFMYIKNEEKFHSINVADGIKSFGIIKLLLKGNYLRKNTLLVIDEPEVHLHPKWQIEYAKLIVELVKRDVKVLVTSHSPFFIEALEILSRDLKANFYLAKEEKNYSIIKESELNEIYELLSESIDTLEEMQIESEKW